MICMLLISFTYYKSVKRHNLKWRGELADTYREAHVCSLLSLLLAHFFTFAYTDAFRVPHIRKKKACEWKSADLRVTF